MNKTLEHEILFLSRQAEMGELRPWFADRLRRQIETNCFLYPEQLNAVRNDLVGKLASYRTQTRVDTAVLGMSGGVDSALTAALFKQADWNVIGFTLPIEQNPMETQRGIEACKALGIEHHQIDLTKEYRKVVELLSQLDPRLANEGSAAIRTRRGNIRARLRMTALYDQAHRFGGLVASTDNFSELGAGFWTLHGDVGDLAPLQGLIKSWEIPWLARACAVPEQIWRAKPTDGLGIGAGDEAQIGATYLEWDITLFTLVDVLQQQPDLTFDEVPNALEVPIGSDERQTVETILTRLQSTWYKRVNPIRLNHPRMDRFAMLDQVDEILLRPGVLQKEETDLTFPVRLDVAARQLSRALRERDMRVVTAESCTAGLIAATLAQVGKSSTILEGSFLTYSAAQKTAALGVSPDLIERQTVYDPMVAMQMVKGAILNSPDADCAIAVTGVAGPNEDQGKPPGYVCIACGFRGQEPIVEEHVFAGKPEDVLTSTILHALRLTLEALPCGT